MNIAQHPNACNSGACSPLAEDLDSFHDFKRAQSLLFEAAPDEEELHELLRQLYLSGNTFLLWKAAQHSQSESTQAQAFELLDAIADLQQDPWMARFDI